MSKFNGMFEDELTPKKIEILEKSEELFSSKGIDRTSVRDISAAADINVAMIKYYFGSKDKLVETLFKWRILKMNRALSKIVTDQDLNPYQKLIGFLKAYMDRIFSNHEFHRVMLREFSKNDSFLFVDAEIQELKSRNLKFINDTIEEGYQQGLFGRKVPAEVITFTIIGAASYSILNEKTYMPLWNIEDSKAYKQHIEKEIFPYFIDSLKAILQFHEK